jgi:hypothetical protein
MLARLILSSCLHVSAGQPQIIYSSPYKFSKHGKSGLYLSELLPEMSSMVDDLCLIKSTHTNAINHDPAQTFFCTGSEIAGKASMGSWLSYGFGSLSVESTRRRSWGAA